MDLPGRRRPLLIGAVALLVATVIAGVAMAMRAAPDAPSGPADDAPPAEPAGVRKLDVDSRRLVLVLEPRETVNATIFVVNDDGARAIAAAPRERGLDPAVAVGEESYVEIRGPHEQILALVALPSAARATFTEDVSALRPVAAMLPAGITLPTPGQAYVEGGPPTDPGALLAPERRAAVLGSMSQLVVSIDGGAYREQWFDGDCGPAEVNECWLSLVGLPAGSGGGTDVWIVHATAASGWLGVVDPQTVSRLNGVPRWLGREAERIARADPAMAAAIADYEWVAGFTWNPSAAGVVTVQYGRLCGAGLGLDLAALGGGPLADDGACREGFGVSVDVPGARVIDAGPYVP
jgi:hypothetical protein